MPILILGPRQCGKTSLARQISDQQDMAIFDNYPMYTPIEQPPQVTVCQIPEQWMKGRFSTVYIGYTENPYYKQEAWRLFGKYQFETRQEFYDHLPFKRFQFVRLDL